MHRLDASGIAKAGTRTTTPVGAAPPGHLPAIAPAAARFAPTASAVENRTIWKLISAPWPSKARARSPFHPVDWPQGRTGHACVRRNRRSANAGRQGLTRRQPAALFEPVVADVFEAAEPQLTEIG